MIAGLRNESFTWINNNLKKTKHQNVLKIWVGWAKLMH